jgi:hypothetical protein
MGKVRAFGPERGKKGKMPVEIVGPVATAPEELWPTDFGLARVL